MFFNFISHLKLYYYHRVKKNFQNILLYFIDKVLIFFYNMEKHYYSHIVMEVYFE